MFDTNTIANFHWKIVLTKYIILIIPVNTCVLHAKFYVLNSYCSLLKNFSRLSETIATDSSIRSASNPETGHLQHFASHRIVIEFFRFHFAANCRHVQHVQSRTAKRDRRDFFRSDFQFSQQLATGTAHVQHLRFPMYRILHFFFFALLKTLQNTPSKRPVYKSPIMRPLALFVVKLFWKIVYRVRHRFTNINDKAHRFLSRNVENCTTFYDKKKKNSSMTFLIKEKFFLKCQPKKKKEKKKILAF